MCNLIFFLFASFRSWFQSRLRLQAEIVALRQQVMVLRRSQRGCVRLRATDRVFWVWLWSGWRSTLAIVKPETVISRHRKGFRLYWTWKSGCGMPGRPEVSQEARDLIRKVSMANPFWGTPRIHGELLKLGIEVSQATVAKYMVRQRKPPSQRWRAFLSNHVNRLSNVFGYTSVHSAAAITARKRFCVRSIASPHAAKMTFSPSSWYGSIYRVSLQLLVQTA